MGWAGNLGRVWGRIDWNFDLMKGCEGCEGVGRRASSHFAVGIFEAGLRRHGLSVSAVLEVRLNDLSALMSDTDQIAWMVGC